MGCTYKYSSELKKLKKIKKIVEEFFNLQNIEKRTRKQEYVNARSTYVFFAKKHTYASLEYIMRQLNQNRESYYNSMKVVESNLISDKFYKRLFNSLEIYFKKEFSSTGNIQVTEVNLLKNKINTGSQWL